jgi:hypothetical protein
MNQYMRFPVPRLNWILAGLFAIVSLAVFTAALMLPEFRQVAYAPVREILLPPPEPITISLLYSTEKEAWLEEVIAEFERQDMRVNGRPVQVQMEKMGSREIYLAVLDGTRQPDIISPASSLQISILQDLSQSQFGRPMVNQADTQICRSVVRTPLVLAAWNERADVLWGQAENQDFWKALQEALVNPAGWAAYGQSEWGFVKFGHTDPLKSNSGFMTILLMTYAYHEKIAGLGIADINNDPDFQEWFVAFERSITEFEYSTGPLMQKMVSYGPSVYDVVAVYEATAIEQAENAVGRYGDLRFYYPPATVWSDHPFCVLQADWVTEERRQASSLFIDYLLSAPAQEAALLRYGFRPAQTGTINLNQAGSPFIRYGGNGLRADLSGLPEVEVPEGAVLNTLLDLWSRKAQR